MGLVRARRAAPERPFWLLEGVHLWSVVAGTKILWRRGLSIQPEVGGRSGRELDGRVLGVAPWGPL